MSNADDLLTNTLKRIAVLGSKDSKLGVRAGLARDNDGALLMAIRAEPGLVKLTFAKPVEWIALPPDQAVALAQLLVRRAMQAGYGKPVTFIVGDAPGLHGHTLGDIDPEPDPKK